MADAAVQAILPRADTPAEVAALALSSEVASGRLTTRLQSTRAAVVTVSRDELAEIAERLYRLAGVARAHHAHLTQGRRCVMPVDRAFRPSLRTRLRRWWRQFVRAHLVDQDPFHG